MTLERIVLIGLSAAAIGFGLVQTSHSQSASGNFIVLPGGPLVSNMVSVWVFDTATKQVVGCQYQGGGPVTCASPVTLFK
jgi:hypothetical protein